MDKKRLTTLVNQPEQLEETDFNALSQLKQEYPYFQALTPLITLGSKKYSPETEKKYLQTSAIYALDRKHLKEILTKTSPAQETEIKKSQTILDAKITTDVKNKVLEELPVDSKPKTKVEADPISQKTHKKDSEISHLPDSFFDELFKEMQALKIQKEHYHKTLEKIESEKTKDAKPATSRKTRSKTVSAKSPASKTKKTPAKSKTTSTKKSTTSKNKVAAKTAAKKAAASKTKGTAKESTSSTRKSKAGTKKVKNDEHDIIEEITSRKELKISDAHKKEQLNIINNFIEKEPVLTKRIDRENQSNKQEAEDLSASSTNLSDDVVSETLAKLMIKQGRKQKAVDIYKKLIWKFPQKKTYFVEIIEELKKES